MNLKSYGAMMEFWKNLKEAKGCANHMLIIWNDSRWGLIVNLLQKIHDISMAG